MVQIDANAMYKIGYSMGGGAKDNTVRDQTMSILGGMALQMIGGAFATRRELRSQSNATLANAQYETDQLGVIGQGPNAIDAAYSTKILNEQRKILKKANNQIAFGINTAKATANKLKAENTIKSHVEGLKYIDKQMSTWNGIYKDGTVEVADKDGKMIRRKVKINPGTSATSHSLGAAFADGSIVNSLDFRDGKWGVVNESIIPTEGTPTSTPTFTPLEDIQLPELDESSALHDHKKSYLTKYYDLGGKSKNKFDQNDRSTLRKDLYNDYSQMSYNQMSSTWFAGSGTDSDSPAHQYITRAEGYTFADGQTSVIEDPFKIHDANGNEISDEEKAKKLQLYTAAMEDLKVQDLDGGDKLDWFIDNYAMNEIEEEFNKGFGDKQAQGGGKGSKTDLGRYLNINNTYSNDAVVRGYMDDIANGDSVVFKDGNGQSVEYKPTEDGGYMSPNGKKISKDRLAKIMGLPKFNYGSVDVGGGDGDINAGNITDEDLSGDRGQVRNKLLKKLGENFKIERNWVFGKDIEIKHKSEKGEEGGKLQVGFNLGDADAREKINKIIQKAGGISLPSSEEKPVSETNPLG